MDNTQPIVADKVDLRDVIMAKLKELKRSLAWLAGEMGDKPGFGYNNMYACFVQKIVSLNQEKLDAINKVLETAYTLDAE